MLKNYKIILFLIGFTELSNCEIVTYDLSNRDMSPQEANKTEHVSKMEPTSLSNKLVDDKNLSKRRSFYGEKGDRNSDFNFWQSQRNFDANPDFGNPLKKNVYQNVNGDMGSKFNGQQGNFNWDTERNRLSFSSNIGNPPNSENKPLGESYISRNKMEDKSQWEKPSVFYTQSKHYVSKEDRDSRYSLNQQNNREMGNFVGDNNEFRVPSNNYEVFHREYNKPKDLILEKETVASVLPRFHIPTSLHHSLNNDFGTNDFITEGTELCKPEKAIIINLKTECPISKHSRNKVVHKYLFSPKAHLSTSPSPVVPNNLYYSSDSNTPVFYV